jgi:hypothetical protein
MEDLAAFQKNRPDTGDKAKPLCYGDLVMLSCVVSKQLAYLCEEGCVMRDSEVEMKVSSRELTFEICTSHDARALHEINKLLQKYGIRDRSSANISLRLSQNDLAHYERLKKTRETEERANEAYSKQMKGRAVTYGDVIQLRHTKRQAFLGVDVSLAPKIESTAKRIFLTSEPDGLVRFKILPRFHYLAEWNTVCFGDNLTLCSADLEAQYLHTSHGFRSEDIGIVHEVNLSHNRSTVWSLECFYSFDSFSEKSVKTGDVVRLYHPAFGGYVAAGHEDAGDRVVLERCAADTSLSSTMWVVEDEGVVSGGAVRTMRSFTLLHLVTKSYLSVTRLAVEPVWRRERAALAEHFAAGHGRSELFSAVALDHQCTPAAGLLFQSLEGGSANSPVSWGGRFHILGADNGRYLHAAAAARIAGAKAGGQARADDQVLVASPALFREDSFEIQRVQDDQVGGLGERQRVGW